MVEVKVMNVGTDGKIGLSIRKAKPESRASTTPSAPSPRVVARAAMTVQGKKTSNRRWHAL